MVRNFIMIVLFVVINAAPGLSANDKAELLIFLGPPASGKSTISQSLKASDHFEHLSVGELLRHEEKQGTALGVKYRKEIREGTLLPSDAINAVVFGKLDQLKAGHKLILDGYPRTADQAKSMLSYAEKRPDLRLHFIELVIDDQKVMDRAANRVSCSQCQTNYNLVSRKPKVPNICDACGGKLESRESDLNSDLFKKRLATYRKNIGPVMEIIRTKQAIPQINVDDKIEDEAKNIREVLMTEPVS